MNKRNAIIAGIAGAAVVLAGVGITFALNAPGPGVPPPSESAAPVAEPTTVPTQTETFDTASSLLFIIEEEKLAHDVYVTLGGLWGSNIFANITASETTHQDLVLPLLEARAIADPRSSEVGVFTDPDLQALYDDLIARGSASLAEAIQVGILIEEKDIADLTEAIAAEDEADVISVYERLLAGSENHLASFQRQA